MMFKIYLLNGELSEIEAKLESYKENCKKFGKNVKLINITYFPQEDRHFRISRKPTFYALFEIEKEVVR